MTGDLQKPFRRVPGVVKISDYNKQLFSFVGILPGCILARVFSF